MLPGLDFLLEVINNLIIQLNQELNVIEAHAT